MRLAFQAAIAVTLAAPAAHAGYTLTPIKVHGKPAASVDVISAAGVLGGTYLNAAGVHLGYLLSGGLLTTLKAKANLDNPRPTGINDKGVVAGLLYSGNQVYGFTRKSGQYKQIWLIDSNTAGAELSGVSINSSGTVAFNVFEGGGLYSPYFGKRSPFQAVNQSLSFVNTINRAGVTAGNDGATYPLSSIFTCTSTGVIKTVQGPGATAAYSGFINDSGAVAGIYQGSGAAYSGFVLKNGKYKTFNAPVPVTDLIVRAFSNTGIVAGTYTDAAGASHGFAWNGKIFSDVVPNTSANEIVTVVGVSDAGDVALDLYDKTTGASVPYVAHCSGNGC